MPNFQYLAMDAKGEQTSGTIEASNETDALAKLRAGGLYPTQIAEAGKNAKKGAAKKSGVKGAPKSKTGAASSRKC